MTGDVQVCSVADASAMRIAIADAHDPPYSDPAQMGGGNM